METLKNLAAAVVALSIWGFAIIMSFAIPTAIISGTIALVLKLFGVI